MAILKVNNITKKFGETIAVDQLSFDVKPGEIFGLLGPNGAGKTTTIRMILDIFKPDSGKIEVLGGQMTEEKKNRIGYLPEERGLYQDIPLERCLQFLASLKGLDDSSSNQRLDDYLERFDLSAHRKKKVKELSKGMQQKAQLIATLIHNPELVIIDEPFTALDPVNTEMVKDFLENMRDEGKAIIMSTHQMNQVEELCDRILVINHGHKVLYGTLKEIQKQFSSSDIIVEPIASLPEHIKGVQAIQKKNGEFRLIPETGVEPHEILKNMLNDGIALNTFKIAVPPLNDIFIKVVQAREEVEHA
jgi:ABC-2 type transport system ATP-binding protein